MLLPWENLRKHLTKCPKRNIIYITNKKPQDIVQTGKEEILLLKLGLFDSLFILRKKARCNERKGS